MSASQRSEPRPNGSIPTLEWLEAHTVRRPCAVPLTECWIWQRTINADGYARITISGRDTSVHRLAYELVHGPVSCWLVIDHLCRQRACINPLHGEAVTQTENILRGEAPSVIAYRTGRCVKCGAPHEPVGGRMRCKACLKVRQHNFYLRKKARREQP